MRGLADIVKRRLPRGWGFLLIVAPVNDNNYGGSAYISDCQRSDIINFLRETLERLEKGQDFPTPEEN